MPIHVSIHVPGTHLLVVSILYQYTHNKLYTTRRTRGDRSTTPKFVRQDDEFWVIFQFFDLTQLRFSFFFICARMYAQAKSMVG